MKKNRNTCGPNKAALSKRITAAKKPDSGEKIELCDDKNVLALKAFKRSQKYLKELCNYTSNMEQINISQELPSFLYACESLTLKTDKKGANNLKVGIEDIQKRMRNVPACTGYPIDISGYNEASFDGWMNPHLYKTIRSRLNFCHTGWPHSVCTI